MAPDKSSAITFPPLLSIKPLKFNIEPEMEKEIPKLDTPILGLLESEVASSSYC